MNDKYLQYEIEDFLNDDSFIAYAKNTSIADTEYWESILSGYPQLEDIIGDAKMMINAIEFQSDAPSNDSVERIWNNIKQNTADNKFKSKTIFRNIYKIPISAAAAIILIFAIKSVINQDEKILTQKAETTSIFLPDSSEVDINIDSKVSFSKSKWDKKRIVSLEGEAFFKVKKGKKFVVKTPKSFVQVLGTSFNVYDRENTLDVKCYTGKVWVISKNLEDTILLTPGLAVLKVEEKKAETYSFDTKSKNTWKDSILAFENKSLKFVFKELERVYNINIFSNEDILKRHFTGQILLKSQKETLEKVCWPMHLKYKIKGNNVYIKD